MPPTSYGAAADRALDLWVKLARCGSSVSRFAARDIRRYGLTYAQFAVLEALYHLGPLPLRVIGQKLLVTSGNVTFVADQLVRSGLVERRPHKGDRRVVRACLTRRGRALMAKVFPQHAECMRRAAAALTPAEQRTLARLLKKWGLSTPQS
jgi:MarR family 2-MHQ and catechol resistance regulon transcriptional repressor